VTEVLLGLMGILVGVVGGYLFGIAQSRNERRDNALADIYGALSLYYRCLIGWSSLPHLKPNVPPGEPEQEWGECCLHLSDAFNDAYFRNSIWLGEETDGMIERFAVDAQGVFERFTLMDKNGYIFPEGVAAKKLLRETLAPRYAEIRRALRSEIEVSRYLVRLPVTDKDSRTPEP
jgi:hypothetical protein